MLAGAARECGVAGGEIFQMVQVSAFQAKGFFLIEAEEGAAKKFSTAFGALAFAAADKDYDFVVFIGGMGGGFFVHGGILI